MPQLFMRILALDHGTVRIGVALSDELKILATPLEFIPAVPLPDFLTRLQQIIAEKGVELMVVGMPRNMNGTYGPATDRVKAFIAVLKEAVSIPIKTWDERLTSVQANRFLDEAEVGPRDRKGRVDKMAAAILLQTYLDSLC